MARNSNQQNEARRLHYYAPGLGDGSIHVQNQKQQQQGLRGRKRTRTSSMDDDKIKSPFRQSVDMANGISSDTKMIRYQNQHRGEYGKYQQNENVNKPQFMNHPADDVDNMYESNNRRTSTEYIPQDNIPNHGLRLTSTSDGPWQLSIVVLLGIIGVLIALFIHFMTDQTNEQQYSYLRSRMKKSKIPYKSPNYRKKTDEWSDDADVIEDDYQDDYRDTEEVSTSSAVAGTMSSGNVAKKRLNIPPSPIPPNDPTARLYYNAGEYRGQESRLRKSATSTQQQQQTTVPTFQTPSRMSRPSPNISSGNVGNRGSFMGAAMAYERSPAGGTRASPRGTTMPEHLPDGSPRVDNANATTQLLPLPPFMDSGVGSGLEGFEHSVAMHREDDSAKIDQVDSMNSSSWAGSFESEAIDDEPVIAGHLRVKPLGNFTPTDSFVKMPSSDEEDKNDSLNTVKFGTPPLTTEEAACARKATEHTTPSSTGYSHSFTSPEDELLSPRRISRGMSSDMDFPTPRVENSTTKRELDMKMLERNNDIPGFALPFMETDENEQSEKEGDSLRFLRDLDGMPMVPNLNASPRAPDSGGSSRSLDAPRSVLLEELHLIRMESGVQGPRWISELDAPTQQQPRHEEHRQLVSSEPPTESPSMHGGQNYMHPMFGNEDSAWCEPIDSEVLEQRRQVSENEAKLREASSVMDPADDPRNSIQHVRNDLTEASDTSSSLSSRIPFSELKLLEVIGGGGFGQVWSAKWKGTPVAVKVLTGAAQAETVPKAVIEEFIAEINMVSGMRHPNICLFMGACLDPPNRAIVTELCENGSLWDALRTPLSSPYQPADGMTRAAWPLELYDTMNQPPSSAGQALPNNPPFAPAGAWPWILVKRVASGTARGMCYLHSGNPPVLHRDLKSANILLDESYTAKLADFGLSRLKAVRSGMTGNCGTVQWMAPEVLCNEDYAEGADVFSYGIILWEMLTQECPYEGMTPIQCALSVLNENNRPTIPDWCPQPFRALIKNCIERNPKDRPTFNQILAALDSLP